MSNWPLQDAKAHFSELIRVCISSGPQTVLVRGRAQAVVLSREDYERLVGQKLTLLEFMNRSPLKGLEIDFERDQSLDRDITL